MKYIYLDEWCWIGLRDAEQKKNNGEPYSTFLSCALKNVENNIWAFPLSLWHLAETQNTGDALKRHPLALIQEKLSNNWTTKSFHQINDAEVKRGLKGIHLKQNEVIVHELANMFGLSRDKMIKDFLLRENVICDDERKLFFRINSMLSDFRTTYSQMADRYSDLTPVKVTQSPHLQSLRQLHDEVKLTEYEMLLINLQDFYNDEQQKEILQDFLPVISDLGKNEARNKTIEYFKNFPSFYTGSMLLYEVVKSAENINSFNKNDFMDIVFLSVAIPYFDVVVTEKQWVHLATQQNLHEIYSTEIISDISSLL